MLDAARVALKHANVTWDQGKFGMLGGRAGGPMRTARTNTRNPMTVMDPTRIARCFGLRDFHGRPLLYLRLVEDTVMQLSYSIIQYYLYFIIVLLLQHIDYLFS